MLQRVLVPLDGSPQAEAILPLVRHVHGATGCDVRLLRIRADEGAADADPGYLARIAARLAERGVAKVTTEEAKGEVVRAIVECVQAHEAGLVAMSTYHAARLRGLLSGTVTDQVIREAPVPTLTLRGDAVVPAPERLRRVLIPVDGSELALRTLPELCGRLGGFAEHLVLLYVAHPGEGEAEVPAEEDLCIVEARRLAEEAGASITCEVRPGRQIAAAIVECAEDRSAGMIALTTRGRSGLARLALGSVTTDLVHQSPLPVLVVR